MIESSIEKKTEQVSYLTLSNSTDKDRLVSVWIDGKLAKLTMVKSKNKKEILLGKIRDEAEIIVKEQR
ncbi:hypothetical protein [Streptococcus sinensis]|uniref:hypothetical protein n=1 Tax=Streptococcus sinensis TaxID=176090 RepID=UPI00272C1E2C|nr:hypothetical protein [Streptococcus sinensis]